jgi:hypothetical protein
VIHTLQSDLYLYKVNRNRTHYLTQLERQRAAMYVTLITFCVTVSTLLWLIYR